MAGKTVVRNPGEGDAYWMLGGLYELKAGADAVQIFDTWAGTLSADECYRWCIEPVQRLVRKVREAVPDARIIGFPRGAGTNLPRYAAETGVDLAVVGVDLRDPEIWNDGFTVLQGFVERI